MDTDQLKVTASRYIETRALWAQAFDRLNHSDPLSPAASAAAADMHRLEAQMLGLADVMAEELTKA